MITLIDAQGTPRTVKTGSFGFYQFEDLPIGQNYVLSVASKRYQFDNPQRVLNLTDSVGDVDFIAVPQ